MNGPVYRRPPLQQLPPLNMDLIRSSCALLTRVPVSQPAGPSFHAEAGQTYRVSAVAR